MAAAASKEHETVVLAVVRDATELEAEAVAVACALDFAAAQPAQVFAGVPVGDALGLAKAPPMAAVPAAVVPAVEGVAA